MALVFAHPFSIVGGHIATVESESDQGQAQEIAVLCSTRRGERALVPDYGISDPVGVGVDLAEINAGLTVYGPAGLQVVDSDITYPDDHTQVATLSFGTDAL
jgi:hypothetical protein